MIRIFHLTAHLGGGVGNAISAMASNWNAASSQFKMRVGILEKPQKLKYFDICEANGAKVILIQSIEQLVEEIESADIVIVNWWNHPLMVKTLMNFPNVPSRLILWAHVSGCSYPILPYCFTAMFERILFTSPYSYENPSWTDSERHDVDLKSAVVYGVGSINAVMRLPKADSEFFRIGYMGTLKFSKLYPRFAELCQKIQIPNARFYLIGDDDNPSLHENIDASGQGERFKFLNYVQDVNNALNELDIFIYPLNPNHFGTTENAILEAMNVGLPVIAFKQAAEKYIIDHDNTGLLAGNEEQFAEQVQMLYNRPEERLRLGDNARTYVQQFYCQEFMVSSLEKQLYLILGEDKRQHDFIHKMGFEAHDWFLNSLGDERKLFESVIDKNFVDKDNTWRKEWLSIADTAHILRESSKGSLYHFRTIFPDDEMFEKWIDMIENAD